MSYVQKTQRFGLLLPSSNSTQEPEFIQTLPPNVSLHCARLTLSNIDPDSTIKIVQELEAETTKIAREIGSRHLAPLEHHKITAQMGRDLTLSQAIQLDQLVGQRLRRAMDPLGDVGAYLKSQKGGPNLDFKRGDV